MLWRNARKLAGQCKLVVDRALDRYMPLLDRPRYSYLCSCLNDRWIAEKVFPGLRGGYFVEAGAADGIGGSSCCILERELGWSGICIEPHPAFAAQLREQRPLARCWEVCLADTEGEVEYIVGEAGTESAYLSGMRSSLEQHKWGAQDTILKVGKPIRVPALPLAQILDREGAPAVIDYAAFDIEGSEIAALMGFPFERYRFRALSIECNARTPLASLLAEKGYREVKNPYNRSKPWERYWLSD